MKRPVRFALTLTTTDRELADALARRMNCSRTEAISRALHLLDCVQERRQPAKEAARCS